MPLSLIKIDKSSEYFAELLRMRGDAFGSAYFSDAQYDSMYERRVCEQLVLIEDERCEAFMTVFLSEGLVYLFLFAVDKPLRSRGIGSRSLKLLRSFYSRPIVIDMDILDESAPDFDVRLRRYDFYRRSGYSLTDYRITYCGKMFELLCDGDFDLERFERLYTRIYPIDFKPALIRKDDAANGA